MPFRLFSYILKYFVPTFLGVFMFLLALMMSFELVKITNLLVTQGIETSTIFDIIKSIATTLIPLTIPLALLFTGVFSIAQLMKDAEFTAMSTFGLSGIRIYLPIFIFTLSIAIWLYQLNQSYIPDTRKNLALTVRSLKSKGFISELKSGRFFTALPNITLFSKDIDSDTLDLKDVFIEVKKEEEHKVISAQSGKLIIDDTDPTYTNLILDLKDGSIIHYGEKDPTQVDKILYDRYKFSFFSKEQSYFINNKASTMNKWELQNFIQLDEEGLKKRAASIGDQYRGALEYYERLNTPLLCLIFPFLGFCLGMSSSRSKSRNSAFTTLAVIASYYALYFTFVGFAKKGEMAPFLSIYLPTILLLVVLYHFSKRLNWVS